MFLTSVRDQPRALVHDKGLPVLGWCGLGWCTACYQCCNCGFLCVSVLCRMLGCLAWMSCSVCIVGVCASPWGLHHLGLYLVVWSQDWRVLFVHGVALCQDPNGKFWCIRIMGRHWQIGSRAHRLFRSCPWTCFPVDPCLTSAQPFLRIACPGFWIYPRRVVQRVWYMTRLSLWGSGQERGFFASPLLCPRSRLCNLCGRCLLAVFIQIFWMRSRGCPVTPHQLWLFDGRLCSCRNGLLGFEEMYRFVCGHLVLVGSLYCNYIPCVPSVWKKFPTLSYRKLESIWFEYPASGVDRRFGKESSLVTCANSDRPVSAEETGDINAGWQSGVPLLVPFCGRFTFTNPPVCAWKRRRRWERDQGSSMVSSAICCALGYCWWP